MGCARVLFRLESFISGQLCCYHSQVEVYVNGEPVDLFMKLGSSGEAFFVMPATVSKPKMPNLYYASECASNGKFRSLMIMQPPIQGPVEEEWATSPLGSPRRDGLPLVSDGAFIPSLGGLEEEGREPEDGYYSEPEGDYRNIPQRWEWAWGGLPRSVSADQRQQLGNARRVWHRRVPRFRAASQLDGSDMPVPARVDKRSMSFDATLLDGMQQQHLHTQQQYHSSSSIRRT